VFALSVIWLILDQDVSQPIQLFKSNLVQIQKKTKKANLNPKVWCAGDGNIQPTPTLMETSTRKFRVAQAVFTCYVRPTKCDQTFSEIPLPKQCFYPPDESFLRKLNPFIAFVR